MIKSILAPLSYGRELYRAWLVGVAFLFSGAALEQLRYAWLAFELALFLIGCLFWATLWAGVPAFAPDVYGAWACGLPALFWAGVQISASLLIIYGLMRPITRWPAFVGAVMHAAQYQAIALSALLTGGQVAIAIYPDVLFVPAHLVLAVEAWRHGTKR
jgi:hypothetical protein